MARRRRKKPQGPPLVTADMLVLDREVEIEDGYSVRLVRPPEDVPAPWEEDPNWPPTVMFDKDVNLVQVNEDPVDWRYGGLDSLPARWVGRCSQRLQDALNCVFYYDENSVREYYRHIPDAPPFETMDPDDVVQLIFADHLKGFSPHAYDPKIAGRSRAKQTVAANRYLEILERTFEALGVPACAFRVVEAGQAGEEEITTGAFVLSDAWQERVFGPGGEDRRQEWEFVGSFRDRFEDGELARYLGRGRYGVLIKDESGDVVRSFWKLENVEAAAAYASEWIEEDRPPRPVAEAAPQTPSPTL